MKNEPPTDTLISEADVRAMVRLLGEVGALPGGHAEKKRHLMNGLMELVGAVAWVWGLAAEMNPDRLPVYVGFLYGGFSEEQFMRFLAVQTSPVMIGITAPYSRDLQQYPGRQLTRTVQQIVPPSRWSEKDARELWDPCGIHPRLLSFHPLLGGQYSGIALYRPIGSPLFTEREARITHILMTEVPWLHELGWPEDRGARVPQLTPRQRLVLELLIQGHTRVRIAAHLDISPHTAGDYVKALYRHFGVHSQAELLRRFMQGDGGDRHAVGSVEQGAGVPQGV